MMKKRNWLIALLVVVVMLFTACGNATTDGDTTEAGLQKTYPLAGKWDGTVDLTEYFMESFASQNEAMKEYVKFENLTLKFVFEFTEESVSLGLDETSTQQFVSNVGTGVGAMVDAMVADVAVANNTTAEAIYANMSVERDTYVQSIIDSLKIEDMVKAMASALELKGAYAADEQNITVIYDDDTYESMKYTLNGDNLSITVSDGTNHFVIECVKSK